MEEQKNISELISQVKSNNQQKTIQKVILDTPKKDIGVQFSFYMERTLLKNLKQKALDRGESIKKIITIAIEKYLETN